MNEFFAPLRAARNERTRKMVANINHLLVNSGILLDFDHDVEPLSLYREGGAITERHLMYALAKKLTAQYGRGESLVQIMPSLGVALSEKQASQLMDTQYILGFEPANTTIHGRAEERANNHIVTLKPQDFVKYTVHFDFSL